MGARLLWVYLGAGVLATAVYFALPPRPQAVLYVAIGLSAAATIGIGTRRHLSTGRWPWYLFALGLALQAAGDATFSFYELVLDDFPDGASLADALYLGGYPFLIAGVAVLIHRLGAATGRLSMLDAASATATFALFQWVFVMQPLAESTGVGIPDRAVWLAYPAMDLLLLAVLARLFVTPAWRSASYRYLAASIALLLVADQVYALTSSSYTSGSWLDALWLLSYVAWGAAALHPSMRDLSSSAVPWTPTLSWRRLVPLGCALVAAPALLAFERATGSTVDALAIAVGGGVLALLILARMIVVVRATEELAGAERLARAEAETAQRLLAEQNDRLRELDRLKDEFVASVSHDLRTPLTSITGYVELLGEREEELDAEQRRFLGIVSRNADRLMALVDDLFFVARVQAGKVELAPRELDLSELARDCVEAARPRAEENGVGLVLETASPLPARGDPRRLAQVLDNLISNAIKFTPSGGHVRVAVDSTGEDALVSVSDTGIGIPAAEAQRLFEPFFRASSALERHIPGTGLGLHITRAIVRAHRGSISVRTNEGAGTTFAVRLPLEPAAALAALSA